MKPSLTLRLGAEWNLGVALRAAGRVKSRPGHAIPRHGGRTVRVAIVIPARYASSRLPGKPLLRETGKFLIQHVYERACAAGCGAEVVVATDDDRILAAVRGFGGRAVMTRADHPSGTDRVAEVAAGLTA